MTQIFLKLVMDNFDRNLLKTSKDTALNVLYYILRFKIDQSFEFTSSSGFRELVCGKLNVSGTTYSNCLKELVGRKVLIPKKGRGEYLVNKQIIKGN